jgi:hypothetical protein
VNWFRRHLVRVGDGSPDLFWALARRAVGGTWRDRATRAAVVAVGILFWWRMSDVWPWLTAIPVGWWIVKAWRAADYEEQVEEEQAAAAEEIARTLDEVYIRMLLHHIGAEAGIHLTELLPLMQRSDARLEHFTREDLRDLLAVLRVPIRPQLRVGVRTGVAGVHRDDAERALTEYLSRNPSPEEAPEV